MDPMGALLVASGACGGAVVRYGVHEIGKARGSGPASILGVNVVGSFIFGMVSATATPQQQLALGTGFCGALTTFSTYSMDTMRMLQKQQFAMAAGYVTASNALSIAAAGAGYALGMQAQRPGSPSRLLMSKLPVWTRMKSTAPRPPTGGAS
jgi:fluoride exporter